MIFTPPTLGPAEEQAIERIEELRRNLRHRVAEPRRWYGGLRRLAFARAVQASNSIEGYNASVDDVIAAVEGEEAMDAATETYLALQGYRDAMTYVLEICDEGDVDIDETLLKSLHFMMLKYDLSKRPGRWRLGDVYVRREVDDEIVYEGPEAERVPELIGAFVTSLREGDGPVLVRAAMAHLNLVMIHPFKDGNGRMARCLQTMVLARDRIVAPVFSSIEEQLGRETEPYYATLGQVGNGSWHPERDARPWVRFCLNAHFQQAQRVLRRIKETEELWGRCEDLALEFNLPTRVVGPLCDAARGLRLRNWSYRLAVKESEGDDIDISTASRDFRALVDRGFLMPRGETRGRYYLASDELKAVLADIRKGRPTRDRADLFSPEAEQLRLDEAS
jgi:Fic family protein